MAFHAKRGDAGSQFIQDEQTPDVERPNQFNGRGAAFDEDVVNRSLLENKNGDPDKIRRELLSERWSPD